MIKMIAGVYGHKMPDGTVKPMDKNSKPFEASPEQEARLIRLGLAVHVNSAEPVETVTPPEDDGKPELPEGVVGIPEYSTESTANELREIGKLCGLTFKVGMTKAEMVAALDAHIKANMVDGVEIHEENSEDDGEQEPTFDASEAVQ